MNEMANVTPREEVKSYREYEERITRDEQGRVIRIFRWYPGSKQTYEEEIEYTNTGKIIRTISAYEQTKTISIGYYDEKDKLIRLIDDRGNVKMEREYDERGNCIHIKDDKNGDTWNTYDEHDNLTHVVDSNGNIEEYRYDKNGNIMYKEINGEKGYYTYDEEANLIEFKREDADGELSCCMKAKYDEHGRIVFQEDTVAGTSIKFEYDEKGLKTRCIYSNGEVHKFEYHANNVMSKFMIVYPDGSNSITEFDEVGCLI